MPVTSASNESPVVDTANNPLPEFGFESVWASPMIELTRNVIFPEAVKLLTLALVTTGADSA